MPNIGKHAASYSQTTKNKFVKPNPKYQTYKKDINLPKQTKGNERQGSHNQSESDMFKGRVTTKGYLEVDDDEIFNRVDSGRQTYYDASHQHSPHYRKDPHGRDNISLKSDSAMQN